MRTGQAVVDALLPVSVIRKILPGDSALRASTSRMGGTGTASDRDLDAALGATGDDAAGRRAAHDELSRPG